MEKTYQGRSWKVLDDITNGVKEEEESFETKLSLEVKQGVRQKSVIGKVRASERQGMRPGVVPVVVRVVGGG